MVKRLISSYGDSSFDRSSLCSFSLAVSVAVYLWKPFSMLCLSLFSKVGSYLKVVCPEERSNVSLISNSLRYFVTESASSFGAYSSMFLACLTGKVRKEPPASFKV